MNRFGEEIRELRRESGLSQQALADLCGVTKSYVSHLENGTSGYPPASDVVQKLASALGGSARRWELLCGRLPEEDRERVIRQLLDEEEQR